MINSLVTYVCFFKRGCVRLLTFIVRHPFCEILVVRSFFCIGDLTCSLRLFFLLFCRFHECLKIGISSHRLLLVPALEPDDQANDDENGHDEGDKQANNQADFAALCDRRLLLLAGGQCFHAEALASCEVLSGIGGVGRLVDAGNVGRRGCDDEFINSIRYDDRGIEAEHERLDERIAQVLSCRRVVVGVVHARDHEGARISSIRAVQVHDRIS